MRTVLGIDPGARATGLCVLSGDQIVAHRTITSEGEIFPAERRYVLAVLEAGATLLQIHDVDLIAVETITRPSWHMKGRAAVDPTALLATAEVLGAVLGVDWPVNVTQIRPNKNGSQPLGTYPGELVSAGERRKAGWEARIGGGQLRHARSAYDVARLATKLAPQNRTDGRQLMTANDIDVATHLAQIHRQALGDQVYVRWEDLDDEAITSSVTAIIAVLAELHHRNLLVPDGGRPLTAEQWAHYQRVAADPRFAELSSDAIGVVKWPSNPLLAPAEKPRTHTPPHHTPATGTTRITVQRACNRCGRNLGDATEKELDACVNGTPLPDVHDECGCDASPVVPAPTETGPWPSLPSVPNSVVAVKDRFGDEWTRKPNGTFCGRADCGNGHPDFAPFVAAKEGRP